MQLVGQRCGGRRWRGSGRGPEVAHRMSLFDINEIRDLERSLSAVDAMDGSERLGEGAD